VLLKDAPILVLDEATSALDSEVEAAIQEQLYTLMEGKTVIAIAHRLSTIAVLDRLVVMDRGASSRAVRTRSCSRATASMRSSGSGSRAGFWGESSLES
jgi:ATP-binding cassette, subfamily B, multidrug efflux pump